MLPSLRANPSGGPHAFALSVLSAITWSATLFASELFANLLGRGGRQADLVMVLFIGALLVPVAFVFFFAAMDAVRPWLRTQSWPFLITMALLIGVATRWAYQIVFAIARGFLPQNNNDDILWKLGIGLLVTGLAPRILWILVRRLQERGA